MKKAVQFGAGNIGRGFIGGLLEQAGYHVVFADVNKEVIDKINEDKKYTIHVMDVECKQEVITNISGVDSTTDAVVEAIKEAEIVTTAVGLVILPRIAPAIVKGIAARMEAGIKSNLQIIACENAIFASSQLQDAVYALLDADTKAYTDAYVGFPNCSVDRIVPPVKSENFIDVVVENYYEWNVEASAFKGEVPEIAGMNLVENLMAYIERKLFTLNTGHAIASYLGYLKGYETVDQSIADEEIYKIVSSAMAESGKGLEQKHGFDWEAHKKYIVKIISRFQNKYLQDDVARVGREPLRKLSATDRLVNPMMTAYGFGLPVDNLLIGIGAALCYNNVNDPQSVELQSKIQEKGVKAAFAEASGVTVEEILAKVEANYMNLQSK
ncbi:mannitol-1-phosphate 5-dehydrogenase [Chakrabartyella piscis]|uniref:mannitol-1-phosphate 5-dehydrogenase n=1 Tax=Chakrabartyella piscis TaxID=2918914 RepID=UPI002958682B|nr:mannitol-1-phosphate 5-dehydrogenase [Chakrabartyella piscis]